MHKPGPDLIDQVVDYWLRKPGKIAWSEIRKDLSERGLSLDRKVLISRVKAGLRRKK